MIASRRRAAAFLWLGMLAAAAATWGASRAAFTVSTANGAQTLSTGSVVLVDNDAGAVMFAVTGLRPGATGQSCLTVTYDGSLTAGVRLYGTGASTTNSLSSYVDLQVDESTASVASGGSCTGFGTASTLFSGTLAAFAAAHTQHSNGLSTWAPTGAAQLRSYRFTYTLASGAPTSTASSSASITFMWEATNV